MEKKEAEKVLDEYRELAKSGQYLPPSWVTDHFELSRLPNGDWFASKLHPSSEGIVVRADGQSAPFFGALGKLVASAPQLGLPTSRELLLGSALRGRYQTFEKGLAIWEAFPSGNNLGYPVAKWNQPDEKARNCNALVAFFDLRGFTNWSANEDAKQIQEVVLQFEMAFQDGFSDRRWSNLFAKGTGDGFMVISDEELFQKLEENLAVSHTRVFCKACAVTIKKARQHLPQELAIGCGITLGAMTQLYVLGRPDYIGTAINDASKIQSVAYDEVCVSVPMLKRLFEDGMQLTGTQLPGKGIRVSIDEMEAL